MVAIVPVASSGSRSARFDRIVGHARVAHAAHWRLSGNESEGDLRATAVTRAWQAAVASELDSQCVAEFVVGGDCRERIDLVDFCDGIAYELKVSPNNAHFEFYRDVFKVLVARERSTRPINRFVFITPDPSARKLGERLGSAVASYVGQLGLPVDVVGI